MIAGKNSGNLFLMTLTKSINIMAITIELFEKMCDYFDGKLSLEEEKKFLEIVAKDPELKKEFEWEEEMIFNSVPSQQEELPIASDAGIHDVEIPEYTTSPPFYSTLRSMFNRKLAIAASLLIGVTILTLLILRWSNFKFQKEKEIVKNDSTLIKKNNPDTTATVKEQIAIAAALKLKKERVNNLGRHKPYLQSESPLLGEVQVAYIKKEYAGTIKLSENITQLRGTEMDTANIKAYAAFYKGIAYLELDKDSIAIHILNDVVTKYKQFPVLVLEAQWNLCKAYYKTGKKEEALKLLQQLLSNPRFIFKSEGKILLNMIKTE